MSPNARQQIVLPFYLMADVSGSMKGKPIDALNRVLPELHTAIATDLVVADKTRFSILDFSDDATVVLPMCDLSECDLLPHLKTRGMTHFGQAFRFLRQQLEADVALLKADGLQVFRPTVFFFSDGKPTDDDDRWKAAVGDVQDARFPLRPNIIAFGLGEADTRVIGGIATVKAFLAAGDGDAAAAIQEFARQLTKSILKSGQAHKPQLIPPATVEGAEEIDVIDLDLV